MTEHALELDAERSELRGSPSALWRLLEGGPAPAQLDPGRLTAEAPLLAAGLGAARAPVARWAVTGLDQPLDACSDGRAGALLVPLGPDRAALRACTPSGLLGLLVRAVDLRPRTRHPGDRPLRLPPERMAALLGARSARAAGLAEADTHRIQPHLDELERHWRIEVRRTDGAATSSYAAGWYLEVIDGALGLWSVGQEGDQVNLEPTDASAVLDEIAALPGRIGLVGAGV